MYPNPELRCPGHIDIWVDVEKVEIIKIESSIFTYFPSDLCKPRHYLEVDQIYVHEIFRLLEKLR